MPSPETRARESARPGNKVYLGDFRILRPAYEANHEESVAWLSRAHTRAEAAIKGEGFDVQAFQRTMERYIERFGCGAASLERRGHDLPDFLHFDWDRMRIFNLGKDPKGAGMGARMEVFAEIADARAEAFYPAGEAPPEDIVHVTCTGYVAPSAAQKLVASRGWHNRTRVTHAYHMGCYASMPALRMASGYLALPGSGPEADAGTGASKDAPPRRVDILHTEACTLHFNPTRHNPEQLVVQSLFSDGHIRYSLGKARGVGPALELLGLHEAIIPGSGEAMGWVLGDTGMRMILAREVPERIAGALKEFLRGLFRAVGIDPAEGLRGAFAVHPGGPRIINQVAALLELRPEQVAASRGVLKDYGNMSSATLPHIWARMAADDSLEPGAPITSLAFGPGLTVYGAVLRKA